MSARTDLRTAVAACIKEMTSDAGYNFSYLHVYDPPLNIEKMTEFPVVNLSWGTERRLNTHLVSNYSCLDLAILMQVDVFLSEADDQSTEIDKVIADFQRYFGANFYVRPAGENRTAFNCLYLSATPWGTEVQNPACGVSLEFELWYSIRLTNPDTFA